MTLAHWILSVLSFKLMEEKGKKNNNTTFPKHTAWGKKLINVLMFQPEQDRTNKSLKRILLVSCTWNSPVGPWVLFPSTTGLSSLTRSPGDFRQLRNSSTSARRQAMLQTRNSDTSSCCVNTTLRAGGSVLPPLPAVPLYH